MTPSPPAGGADQIVEREVRELLRRGRLDPAADPAAVRRLIDEVVADYQERGLVASMPALPDPAGTAAAVHARVAGAGPLQPYLDDPEVEEIWINEPGKVFVARAGQHELTTTVLSEQEVRDLVEMLLRDSGRRVDLSSPFVDATLADGSRLHVVIPDITRRHWAVNIRKFVVRCNTLDELVRLGSLTAACARFLEAAVAVGLNLVVSGGTGTAWVTAPPVASPAETGRRLVIQGGFVADGGRLWRLGDRARALGFGDLRGYLQARCDAGWSVPGLAAELGTSDWHVGAALEVVGVRVASAAERRARTRMRASEQRLAARVAELGFEDVEGYLRDRLVAGGWTLAQVEAELGAHRRTVRRLMEAAGIRRVRRTAAECAAAAAGKQSQQLGWEARRAARLAELGFDSLAAYARARMDAGWSVKRMRAELRVGIAWLRGELARLGMRSSGSGLQAE